MNDYTGYSNYTEFEYIYDIMESMESYCKSDLSYDIERHLKMLQCLYDLTSDEFADERFKLLSEINRLCTKYQRCPFCFKPLIPTKIDENSIPYWVNPYECDEELLYCNECDKRFDPYNVERH